MKTYKNTRFEGDELLPAQQSLKHLMVILKLL